MIFNDKAQFYLQYRNFTVLMPINRPTLTVSCAFNSWSCWSLKNILRVYADKSWSLKGHQAPQRLLSLLVNHWPRTRLLYTDTHKNTHVTPLRSRHTACEPHHSVRRVKSNEKCHRRITPPFPEWPLQHSGAHPSFLLPFYLFLSHEGPIIWRGWLRCTGGSCSWATNLLYTGVDIYFKDERGEKGRRK